MTPRISFYGKDVRLPAPSWMPYRNMAPMSAEGERMVFPGHTSATRYLLKPGAEIVDTFELNKIYLMRIPGEYRVVFYFRAPDKIGKGLQVISNELILTLTEKK